MHFLIVHIDNAYSVASLIGNLNAEVALRSNNLQQTYETQLSYNDTTYTAAVDNNTCTNKVGDIVNYNGTKHYVNASAANGSTYKGGLAKSANIYQLCKSKNHYHLVHVSSKAHLYMDGSTRTL